MVLVQIDGLAEKFPIFMANALDSVTRMPRMPAPSGMA